MGVKVCQAFTKWGVFGLFRKVSIWFLESEYGFTKAKPDGVSRWSGGRWVLVYGFMVLYIKKLEKVKYKEKKRGRKRVKYYIRGETKTRNQIFGDFGLEMARGQWVMAIWFS